MISNILANRSFPFNLTEGRYVKDIDKKQYLIEQDGDIIGTYSGNDERDAVDNCLKHAKENEVDLGSKKLIAHELETKDNDNKIKK